MFRNLFTHCESKWINTFEYVPLTFVLEVDNVYFCQDYEKFVNYFTHSENACNPPAKGDHESSESIVNKINSKFMHSYQISREERGPVFAKMIIPYSHF